MVSLRRARHRSEQARKLRFCHAQGIHSLDSTPTQVADGHGSFRKSLQGIAGQVNGGQALGQGMQDFGRPTLVRTTPGQKNLSTVLHSNSRIHDAKGINRRQQQATTGARKYRERQASRCLHEAISCGCHGLLLPAMSHAAKRMRKFDK